MTLEDFINSFNITQVIIFIASGLFLLLVDRPYLKKKGYTRDEKFCTAVGFFYIFGIPALYLLISLFLK